MMQYTTQDQLEFAISQYVDGTLSADEVRSLEQRLAEDADARILLADYRKVDVAVKQLPVLSPLPAIQWDQLAAHISRHVTAGAAQLTPEKATIAEDAKPLRLVPRPEVAASAPSLRWALRFSRLAVAACLLMGMTLAVYHFADQHANNVTTPRASRSGGTLLAASGMTVSGPQVERPDGAALSDIAISGPSVAHADMNGDESLFDHSSHLAVASEEPSKFDGRELPY